MKTGHDVINAPDYYSISGVLKEHLKWPLCLQKKQKKAYIKQAPSFYMQREHMLYHTVLKNIKTFMQIKSSLWNAHFTNVI